MTRFTPTRLHPASAVLFLLAAYAVAALVYAAFQHSGESEAIWAIVAATSSLAGALYQVFVASRRRARDLQVDEGETKLD